MFGLAGLVYLAMFAGRSIAQAETNGPLAIAPPKDEIERWVPSFSAALGMSLQKTSGDFVTGDILDPAWVRDSVFFPSPTISAPDAGEDLAFAAIASFSFEFMTPGLLTLPGFAEIEVPGRPRLFAHADAVPSFSPEYRTAKTGDPGPPSLPLENSSNPETIVVGQGGVEKLHTRRWQFAAGAGVAFTADLWERRFRIKPSFEYMTHEVAITGEVRRAAGLILTPTEMDDYRFIHLSTATKKRFHGLGVGLEIEQDTRRAGPVLLSVFAGVRGYYFLGDLDMVAIARNSFGETATFRARAARYAYRGAVGVRVRFAPE